MDRASCDIEPTSRDIGSTSLYNGSTMRGIRSVLGDLGMLPCRGWIRFGMIWDRIHFYCANVGYILDRLGVNFGVSLKVILDPIWWEMGAGVRDVCSDSGGCWIIWAASWIQLEGHLGSVVAR